MNSVSGLVGQGPRRRKVGKCKRGSGEEHSGGSVSERLVTVVTRKVLANNQVDRTI